MNKLLKKTLLFAVVILFSFFLIEKSIGDYKISTFVFRAFKYKKLTVISFLFLSSIFLIIIALLNNLLNSILLYFLFVISFSVANYQKLLMRQEPIFPHDLKESVNIIDLFNMMITKDKVISIVSLSLLVLLFFFINKLDIDKNLNAFFSNLTSRFIFLVVGVSGLMYIYGINSYSSSLDGLITKSGYQDFRWNPMQTYDKNGIVISFIKNFPGVSMEKPIGYSVDKMNELSNEYEVLADEINLSRNKDSFEDINIIYILSESLADPRRISTLELSENPLEFIQDEKGKNAAGSLFVTAYGGGTANVEFEILTSLSTEFLLPNMSLPYQHILSYKDNFPSFARFSKKNASRASIAAHSYHSRFYQRRKVFNNLGFDEQIFEEDFTFNDTLENGLYISDESSYKEILMLLEGKEGVFTHFITMQNHTPYLDIFSEHQIGVTSEIQDNLEAIKNYTEGIRITDEVTQDFIDEISKIEEDTIVLLYGDHLPSLYSNYLTEDDKISKYTTDFFIYSNFSNKKLEISSLTPTYYVNNLIYELADVKITPFMAFIDRFNKEFDGIIGEEFILKNGDIVVYENLSPYQKELVDTYIMIQYDVIEGNCYFTDMCN